MGFMHALHCIGIKHIVEYIVVTVTHRKGQQASMESGGGKGERRAASAAMVAITMLLLLKIDLGPHQQR